MDVVSRSDENASRVDQYDFDRLEQSVEFLLKEHERLSAEREALLSELVDREQKIATLENALSSGQERRAAAIESVDALLARLEQLQATVTNAAEVSS
jgi:chromosome segregation ATPase